MALGSRRVLSSTAISLEELAARDQGFFLVPAVSGSIDQCRRKTGDAAERMEILFASRRGSTNSSLSETKPGNPKEQQKQK